MLKHFFFGLALSWTLLIAFFCLIPSTSLPGISVPNIDKLVHVSFHFVFTTLWFLFFEKYLSSNNYLKPLRIALVLSFLYGIVIEIFQELFTTTRRADIHDVMANLVGAILAYGCVILLNRSKSCYK